MNKLEKRTLDPKRSSDRIIAFITDFGIQFLLSPRLKTRQHFAKF
jgi:hypothetical protein